MHVETTRTLLLSQGYEPIKIISWQRAITLLALDKVEVVEQHLGGWLERVVADRGGRVLALLVLAQLRANACEQHGKLERRRARERIRDRSYDDGRRTDLRRRRGPDERGQLRLGDRAHLALTITARSRGAAPAGDRCCRRSGPAA